MKSSIEIPDEWVQGLGEFFDPTIEPAEAINNAIGSFIKENAARIIEKVSPAILAKKVEIDALRKSELEKIETTKKV